MREPEEAAAFGSCGVAADSLGIGEHPPLSLCLFGCCHFCHVQGISRNSGTGQMGCRESIPSRLCTQEEDYVAVPGNEKFVICS